MAPDCAVQRSVIRCMSRTIGSTSYGFHSSQTKFLSYTRNWKVETMGTITNFRSCRLSRTTFLYAQRCRYLECTRKRGMPHGLDFEVGAICERRLQSSYIRDDQKNNTVHDEIVPMMTRPPVRTIESDMYAKT